MNQVVYDLGNGLRMIDFSKHIDPATETRRCKLDRFNTGGPIPDFHTNIDLMTHLGTHVECPYHHNDDWADVMSLPLTTFVGRAVYINLEDKVAENAYVTAEVLDKYCSHVKEGDIVILDSAYRIPAFTKLTNTPDDKRLKVNGETAQWLRDKKIKAFGFGLGISVESCNEDVKPFHDILMEVNVVFIEVLMNLEQLQKDVFFMSYSPLPIKGLDSSPVRCYGIEGLAEFS